MSGEALRLKRGQGERNGLEFDFDLAERGGRGT
jgi:hypothetical protein